MCVCVRERERLYSFFSYQFTGDFVRQNGLEIGDCLTIYEDESKNLVSFSCLL